MNAVIEYLSDYAHSVDASKSPQHANLMREAVDMFYRLNARAEKAEIELVAAKEDAEDQPKWALKYLRRAEKAEAELVQLRAEVERLKGMASWAHICIHHNDAERAGAACPCCAITRAEKAEADTARLNWLETTNGSNFLAMSLYEGNWITRAYIDASMKEDSK